jgi:3,4-dihydroxy-2-butanone 4-phosphate synthase
LDESSESKETMKKGQSVFSSIEAAMRELRAGRMIVIVDDEDRENEGDLMMAAELVHAGGY